MNALWTVVMPLWDTAMAEPRWWTIVGLGLDLVGGVLVAATAWYRIQMINTWKDGDKEPLRALWWRRGAVLSGGLFLSGGFALQMYATWLQVP